MQMVFGVALGATAATVLGPMLQAAATKAWAGAGDQRMKPLWTVITGALAATVVGFLPFRGKREIASYLLVGGGVAAVVDLLNTHVVPKLPVPAGWKGMGDYVQLPYSGYGRGMGDYVQLPYSGYGSPQQVERGQFNGYGSAQQVVEGDFGIGHHDSTFSPSF